MLKNPARYLAPVALIAVAVAVALLVHSRVNSSHHAPIVPTTHRATISSHLVRRHSFYVIKPGDTLSRISVVTRVPIATLEALNPSIQNPNALQTGVRLRLQR